MSRVTIEQMTNTAVFTIGHSTHDVATFQKLLTDNAIEVVVDVRSAPYSRHVPQFNKKDAQAAIVDAGVKYIFMGDSIGGKPTDSEFLDLSGKVIYSKLAASKVFQHGLNRLAKGLQGGWLIALMCSEENPLKCHRHLLIANELELKKDISVWHIRSDGSRERAKKHLDDYSGQMRLF